MEKTGTKPADLAKELRVSLGSVYRYINGIRIPRACVMHRIAKATAGEVGPSDFYPSPRRGAA